MRLKVKYFSWIRIKLQKAEEELVFENEQINFEKFKTKMLEHNKLFEEVFNDKSIKYFINYQEMNKKKFLCKNNDEIGILPPVTGG